MMVSSIAAVRSRLDAFRFGQLALCFAVFLIVLPLLKHGILIKGILFLLLLNSLLVADAARPGARMLRRIGWALWSISVVGLLVDEFGARHTLAFASKCVGLGAHTLLLLVCAGSILGFVLRARRVNLDSIFASIVVYQLTGLFFA
jgi:hypothetical protein